MLMLIKIFYEIDNFCQDLYYGIHIKNRNKMIKDGRIKRIRNSRLLLSEIMTIIVYFHLSNYRSFKHFYLSFVSIRLKNYFPNLVSYSRFVELMSTAFVPLVIFCKKNRTGKVTGLSFIDSTSLHVCDNHRINRNMVFSNIAKRGKTSMGWFYGFKLHLIVNEKGEIISFLLSPGNVDDRNRDVMSKLTKDLFGKLFGDRGYISQKLFEELLERGIQLITRLKKNMKSKVMHLFDKILLRKRAIIETINDQLKNICQIEHTRHRSPKNFLTNLIAGLVAYTYLPKKPSLKLGVKERQWLPILIGQN